MHIREWIHILEKSPPGSRDDWDLPPAAYAITRCNGIFSRSSPLGRRPF